MYFLQCIRDSHSEPAGVNVEFRLACSGEFYNCTIETFDWRKSDLTRTLLAKPFKITVVSRPFNSYPQELCVRLNVPYVTESGGPANARHTRTYLPDDDIVEDLCAVLTLLSRRLVSVVVKVGEKHAEIAREDRSDYPSLSPDVATPIIQDYKVVAWPSRPATIYTSVAGQRVEFNDPPPVGVSPSALASFLINLPSNPYAQEVVYAAQLYKSALELLIGRPDTAYIALVSVVESFAEIALKEFEPSEHERLASKSNVIKRAREFGLDEEKSRLIALESTKGDRWLAKKFVKFCTDYCPVTELAKPDRVFKAIDYLYPSPEKFPEALSRIYRARSSQLHVGLPFPLGISIGTRPTLNIREMPLNLVEPPDIPPLVWFERVTSIAVRNFLLRNIELPFVETL